MSHRQTIDFLRRRYAAAILGDDRDTATRLRLQLDAIMNSGQGAGRPDEVPGTQGLPLGLPAPPLATQRSPRRLEPGLHLVRPVTGLLEGRRER